MTNVRFFDMDGCYLISGIYHGVPVYVEQSSRHLVYNKYRNHQLALWFTHLNTIIKK